MPLRRSTRPDDAQPSYLAPLDCEAGILEQELRLSVSWSNSLSPMVTGAWEARTSSGSAPPAEVTADTPLVALFKQHASTIEDPRKSLVNLSYYDRSQPIDAKRGVCKPEAPHSAKRGVCKPEAPHSDGEVALSEPTEGVDRFRPTHKLHERTCSSQDHLV